MDLCFIYDRFHIKSIKNELLSQRFSSNEFENSQISKEIRFNIVKCNPFFCKFEDLNGVTSFEKVRKREIIKPFALWYSSKNRIERFESDNFKTHTSTDITVDQIAVNMSINQIVSFLSMIRNTSNILHEKYTEKIKNDAEINMAKKMVKNSEPTKLMLDRKESAYEETMMFKETFEVFSNRYYQVPKRRVTDTFDIEDDEEEKSALNQKQENLLKLNSKVNMVRLDVSLIVI